MKSCGQWNPFLVKKISPRAGLEPGTARSVSQRLTLAAGVLQLVRKYAIAIQSTLYISNIDISKYPLISNDIVWTTFLFLFTFQPTPVITNY